MIELCTGFEATYRSVLFRSIPFGIHFVLKPPWELVPKAALAGLEAILLAEASLFVGSDELEVHRRGISVDDRVD